MSKRTNTQNLCRRHPGRKYAAIEDETPAEVHSDSISVEELQDLRTRAAKADENWDKYLRAVADLDNYRKRVAARRRNSPASPRARRHRVAATLDNLERAIDAAQTHALKTPRSFRDSPRSTANFAGRSWNSPAGNNRGVGQPFDPTSTRPSARSSPRTHGRHVVEQFQRGYKLADRLLRPARVVISKGLSSETDSSTKADLRFPNDQARLLRGACCHAGGFG